MHFEAAGSSIVEHPFHARTVLSKLYSSALTLLEGERRLILDSLVVPAYTLTCHTRQSVSSRRICPLPHRHHDPLGQTTEKTYLWLWTGQSFLESNTWSA